MAKKVVLIFLSILLFTIVTSLSNNEPKVPEEDKKNIEITKKLMHFAENIEDLKLKKEGIYDEHREEEETMKSKGSDKGNHSDMDVIENSGMFQGDIVLTENDADEIADEIVDEAVKDGIDVSDVAIDGTQ